MCWVSHSENFEVIASANIFKILNYTSKKSIEILHHLKVLYTCF